MTSIKLIVALGNNDPAYTGTFHNIGYEVADYLRDHLELPWIHFLKNDQYMNEAGLFVKKTIKKYKINPSELLIIHDDNDIDLGKFKISFNRSSAGHKGIQNIIDKLGTQEFWRIRIGIQKKKNGKKIKAGKFVLKKISSAEQKNINAVLPLAAQALSKLLIKDDNS